MIDCSRCICMCQCARVVELFRATSFRSFCWRPGGCEVLDVAAHTHTDSKPFGLYGDTAQDCVLTFFYIATSLQAVGFRAPLPRVSSLEGVIWQIPGRFAGFVPGELGVEICKP